MLQLFVSIRILQTVYIVLTSDRVLLLSLQAIILMAVEELKTLADSMTGAFRKDSIELSPTTSLPGLNDRFAEFKEFSHCLQEAISMLGASRTLTDAYSVLCNDYCRPDITWDKDEGALRFMGEAISLWQKTGHYGIAYVLQTKRLLQYPELAKSECQRLIRCRELFLTEIGAIMEQFNLNMQAPRSLYGSQLFLPSKLLRIPEIASHFQNTKLPDCLGRSVSHAFSDAGCIVEWPSEHLNHMDLLGRSALYFACRDGGKCLKRLLKSGADYRKPALNGLTPLHVAASMGHENTCKQLWSWICNDTNRVHNYDLHPDSTGRTPFMWAAWSGNEPTLRFFYRKIDQPRRLREGHDSRGRTAVCLAACKGHTHIVKYLLEEGFASDIVDVQGRSPFWYAAQRSHCDILALLAERGAYVDCRDNDGLTPLAEAARQGHEDVISYLLRFNYYDRLTGIEVNPRINIDSKDNLGKSPLILAAEAQKAKCVRLLFEHGPLLLDPDDVRKTSVIARRTGDEDTWNIVRRYMTIFPQYVSV